MGSDFNGLKLKRVKVEKVRDMYEWVLNDGTFYLMDEYDEIIIGGTELWMMIDIGGFIIHKHGPEKMVKMHFDNFQRKMRQYAKESVNENDRNTALRMANDMVMLNVTKIPLEEINHALAASGYIRQLLIKYSIIENPTNEASRIR